MTQTSRKTASFEFASVASELAGLLTTSSGGRHGSSTPEEVNDVITSGSRSTEAMEELISYPPRKSPSDIDVADEFVFFQAINDSVSLDFGGEDVAHESYKRVIFSRIESFRQLEEDWNGYGASPLPDDVLNIARGLATRDLVSDLNPEVFPTGRQSIQFEFRNERGDEAELEIFSRDDSLLVIDPSDGDMFERRSSLKDAISLIDEFLAN